MREIVHPHIQNYLEQLTPASETVLQEMEERAAREAFPIVGPLVGRLLAVLARAINATRIFEMGSGFGYSGLWFASALPAEGQVVLTDTTAERAQQARDYFARAQQAQKLTTLVGDAVELITQQSGLFDLIFLDADKERYPLAFQRALPKLKVGGLFIADNILWSGEVTRPTRDPETVGLQQFGRLLYTTPHLLSTILPLRDGVSISVKTA